MLFMYIINDAVRALFRACRPPHVNECMHQSSEARVRVCMCWAAKHFTSEYTCACGTCM